MITLSDSAASAIEVDVINGHDPEFTDEYGPIRAAWNNGRLDETTPGLRAALTALSNACDEIGHGREASDEERKFNRRASASLAGLTRKVQS